MPFAQQRSLDVRAGFTLTELLVVVAIVAVLIALLMPALGAVRQQARSTACLANLHTFGHALISYCGENRDHLPLSSHTTGSIADGGSWLSALRPSGVEPDVRCCPEDPFREQRLTSYCTNDYLEPLAPGFDYDVFTGKPLPGGRTKAYCTLSQLPRPAATVFAVEVAGEGDVDHLHCVGWTKPEQVAAAIAVTRHRQAANYLFCDGHATTWTWERLRRSFLVDRNFFNPETAW